MFMFGMCETPCIRGYEFRPRADEFLTGTGYGREWFLGENETHWFLTMAAHGSTARGGIKLDPRQIVTRDDVSRKAFRKCPLCGGSGYLDDNHICGCEYGRAFWIRGMYNLTRLVRKEQLPQPQLEELIRSGQAEEKIILAWTNMIKAFDMKPIGPKNGKIYVA